MRRAHLLVIAFGFLAATSCSGKPARSPVAGSSTWGYQVDLDAAGETLAVEARFGPGASSELSVTEGAEPWVREVTVAPLDADGRVATRAALPAQGTSWFLPACPLGCVVRYRFLLREAADEIDADDTANALGPGFYEATAPAFLLHPLVAHEGDVFRVLVRTPPPFVFATGITRSKSGIAGDYEGRANELGATPYSVFGKLRVQEIAFGAQRVQFAIGPGKLEVSDADLVKWIERAGHAVTSFYGQFPIDRTMIAVVPTRGSRVGFGRTMAGGGASILINVGRDTSVADLDADWVATHEMIHLAFPTMGRPGAWIEEGLATYLEPMVRARAGMVGAQDVWRGFHAMMHNGLPARGDQGLERTHTWGRIYWGGALFCFLADVEIRKRTNNARGLDDAVRGILRAGGNDAARWDLDRAFAEGDRATGVPVLRELRARLGTSPEPLPAELDGLWRALGVSEGPRGEVLLDDAAPLAAVRRAMTSPKP
ncbi:MAG: hypothetical protein JWM74_3080 [Myxococcaceae bacterium]|nr:hypothetical protein [Myxococcaceae bacterium]